MQSRKYWTNFRFIGSLMTYTCDRKTNFSFAFLSEASFKTLTKLRYQSTLQ